LPIVETPRDEGLNPVPASAVKRSIAGDYATVMVCFIDESAVDRHRNTVAGAFALDASPPAEGTEVYFRKVELHPLP
jgi:hypothetical protein